VDLHNGGVDHGVLHVRLIRGGIEKPFENISFYPVSIPLEDSVPAAELGWKVAPWAAGSGDPQHRLDKSAVIRAAAAGVRLLPPAMRLHFRPLGVSQHISVHPKLESQYLARGNPKSQQTLEDRRSLLSRDDLKTALSADRGAQYLYSRQYARPCGWRSRAAELGHAAWRARKRLQSRRKPGLAHCSI